MVASRAWVLGIQALLECRRLVASSFRIRRYRSPAAMGLEEGIARCCGCSTSSVACSDGGYDDGGTSRFHFHRPFHQLMQWRLTLRSPAMDFIRQTNQAFCPWTSIL